MIARAVPLLALWCAACSATDAVSLAAAGGRVVVTDARTMFAEYRADAPRGPALWPLCAPGGEPVTRPFPFFEQDGEAHDHPHQTSCWFAHGDVDGVDFWQGPGRIVPVGPPLVDKGRHRIEQLCEWRGPDGVVHACERRSLQFASGADWRTVDLATSLSRRDAPVHFGDTKEGTFALRLRREFTTEGDRATGTLRNSEGLQGAAVWGKPARWVAYGADLDGVAYTVAMFDHPTNHGHPTTWHARGYGLCAANPFGRSEFLGEPKGAGELVVPAGAELRLRYRVWLHRGPCDAAAIDAAWREFASR